MLRFLKSRGLWPDRNPLRRHSDRAEAAIVAGLLAAFLVGAPAASVAAGCWAYTAGVRVEHAQQTAWHQVPAVLLEAAPADPAQHVQVPARWTAPNGTPRTGKITITAGTAVGSTVLVWTDAAGRLESAPLRHGTVIGRAVLAAIWAPVIVGLLLLGAWRLARRTLERQRLAAWEADWLVTGPRWTSRR
jgi:hypothetical protein